jgi:hypothetical protein
MLVDDEIVSHFVQRSFLDPDDDRVLDVLLSQRVGPLRLSDITDRETLRAKIRMQQAEMRLEPEGIPVPPQERRKAARRRLNDRARSVAARVLSDLGVARAGREVSKAIGGRSLPNAQALYAALHGAVNDELGIGSGGRAQLTFEQCERGLEMLDEIGDRVRDQISEALGRSG